MMFMNDPIAADKARSDERYTQRFALSEIKDGERVINHDKLSDVLVQRCGAPLPLAGHTLREYLEGPNRKHQKAAEQVKEFMMQTTQPFSSHGLYMSGLPRTGKTSLAVAAMRMGLRKGLCVRFVSADSFIRFYQDRIELSKNAQEFDDVGERLDSWNRERWYLERVYDILVFDDFGRMTTAEYFANELHPLIRHRYEAGLRTIITSNVTKGEVPAMIDDRMREFLRSEYTEIKFADDAVVA